MAARHITELLHLVLLVTPVGESEPFHAVGSPFVVESEAIYDVGSPFSADYYEQSPILVPETEQESSVTPLPIEASFVFRFDRTTRARRGHHH